MPVADIIDDVANFNINLGVLLINNTSEELCKKSWTQRIYLLCHYIS